MSDSQKQREHAQALLALRVSLDAQQHTQKDSNDKPVSDEELALFVEGRLPFARQQEIQHALLVDDTLMRRWLSVSEACGVLAPQTEVSEKLHTNAAPWWRHWGTWLLSSATGACMLAVGWFAGDRPSFDAQQQVAEAPVALHAEAEMAAPAPAYSSSLGGKYSQQRLHTAQSAQSEQQESASVAAASDLATVPSDHRLRCAALAHPLTAKAGELCVLSYTNVNKQAQSAWLWIAATSKAGDPRGKQQWITLPQASQLQQLTASQDAKWIAAQSKPNEKTAPTEQAVLTEKAVPREYAIYSVNALHQGQADNALQQRITDPAPNHNVAPYWQNGAWHFSSFYDFDTQTYTDTAREWRLHPVEGGIDN